jgi:carotenoid cleavage dioxygenase-like enzyme
MTRLDINRRQILYHTAGMAFGALLTPELARAEAQVAAAATAGIQWRLGFADRDEDLAPKTMALVSGSCPQGLAGTLYRNGPALFRRPGGAVGHWFDGDGLVRAFRIAGGQASLEARFVDTPKRRRDAAARAVVTPGFGTAGKPGLALASADDANAANIAVLPVGGELWALWEAGSPTALDPATLATKGTVTLRYDLAHKPFLAHPRAEPDGDIWNLGVTGDKAVVWRLGADGGLLSAEMIELPVASYIHDFTATERHLVIVLQPLIQTKATPAFIDGFAWRGGEATRILVIDKSDLGDRRLYELPAFFAFHHGAAWAEADGTIRFDTCAAADPAWALKAGRDVINGDWTPLPPPTLSLVTLPPEGGEAKMESSGVAAEFPRTDPNVSGWPRSSTIHATGDGASPLFRGIAVHNWGASRSDAFDFGPAHLVEEAVFVPKTGGGELFGWLLVPSINLSAKATELHVFDAEGVNGGPLCTWRAEACLPASLHGAWVAAQS